MQKKRMQSFFVVKYGVKYNGFSEERGGKGREKKLCNRR
jgi:hypothetical protein